MAVTYTVPINVTGSFSALDGTVFNAGLTVTGDTQNGGVLNYYRAGGVVLQGVKSIKGGLTLTDVNFRCENIGEISNKSTAVMIAASQGGSRGFFKNCNKIESEEGDVVVFAGSEDKPDFDVRVKVAYCKAKSIQKKKIAFVFSGCWAEVDRIEVEDCGDVGVSVAKSSAQMSHINTKKGFFAASESLLHLKEVQAKGVTFSKSVAATWGIFTESKKEDDNAPLLVYERSNLGIKDSNIKGDIEVQANCYVRMWTLDQTKSAVTLDQGTIVASYSTFGQSGAVPMVIEGVFHGYECRGKFNIPGLPSKGGDRVRSLARPEDLAAKRAKDSVVSSKRILEQSDDSVITRNGTSGVEPRHDIISRAGISGSDGYPLVGGIDALSSHTINNQSGGLYIIKCLKPLLMRTYDSGLFQSSKNIDIAARKNNIIIAGGLNFAVSSGNLASPPWGIGATSQSTVMT
jgi:hypothetical protein